jgi:hypothetical protein
MYAEELPEHKALPGLGLRVFVRLIHAEELPRRYAEELPAFETPIAHKALLDVPKRDL